MEWVRRGTGKYVKYYCVTMWKSVVAICNQCSESYGDSLGFTSRPGSYVLNVLSCRESGKADTGNIPFGQADVVYSQSMNVGAYT